MTARATLSGLEVSTFTCDSGESELHCGVLLPKSDMSDSEVVSWCKDGATGLQHVGFVLSRWLTTRGFNAIIYPSQSMRKLLLYLTLTPSLGAVPVSSIRDVLGKYRSPPFSKLERPLYAVSSLLLGLNCFSGR